MSSFGVGGTNAHIVLEQSPETAQPPGVVPFPAQVLVQSAKSEEALDQQVRDLADHLEQQPDVDLADVAATLQTGRAQLPYRAFCVGRDVPECVTILRDSPRNKSGRGRSVGAERPLAFMFPGQGAQYLGMGHDLYQFSSVFRDALDACHDCLRADLPVDFEMCCLPPTARRRSGVFKIRHLPNRRCSRSATPTPSSGRVLGFVPSH